MAAEQRPWQPPAPLDTPRRRLTRAGVRDLWFVVPLVAAVVAGGVVAGRGGAFAVLALAIVGRTAVVAAHGATPAMRRLGIIYVRLGTGAPPERWRLVLHQLGPLLLVGLFLVGLGVFPVAAAAYLAALAAGWWRARRAGHADVEPMMALAGLDVWWAGDPPTPSGTSEPPGPATPPPTPAGPATPGPAPRPGWPGRR